MQILYKPLFKLKLLHNYFTEGNCPIVGLVPSAETNSTMLQLGIRLVKREFGYEAFYNEGEAHQTPLLSVDAPIRLNFILRAKDPAFLNYTNIPLSNDDSTIRYMTNIGAGDAPSSTAFEFGEAISFPLRNSFSQVEIQEPETSFAIIDELGNELHTYPLEEGEVPTFIKPINEEKTVFNLDLSKEASGLCYIRKGEGPLNSFIHPPVNLQAGDLALLSIYIGDTESKGQHLIKDGVVTPTDFTINFQARATKWRYFLIDRGEPGHQGFKLIDQQTGKEIPLPDGPQATKTLPDDSEAVVLQNEEEIVLQQRPGLRFKLNMQSANGREVSIALPSADASRLNREGASAGPPESTTFYSDMYVYL